MADDITELRMRVEAARERLSTDAAYARKVELRLDDLVHIVEGSLARQSAELAAAQARVGELGVDLDRALARAEQAIGEAARADRLATENGELKQMVMTLLEVIEGRQKSPLGAVMQKLEENVAGLVETAAAAATESAGKTAIAAPQIAIDPQTTEIDAPIATETAPAETAPEEIALEDAGPEEIAAEEITADEITAEDVMPETMAMEDLSEIALYDATGEVVEPDSSTADNADPDPKADSANG